MAAVQQTPLRALTDLARRVVGEVARAPSERADRVARAKGLLAVADGATFAAASRAAGGAGWAADGQYLHHPPRPARCRPQLAGGPNLVRDRRRPTEAESGRGG